MLALLPICGNIPHESGVVVTLFCGGESVAKRAFVSRLPRVKLISRATSRENSLASRAEFARRLQSKSFSLARGFVRFISRHWTVSFQQTREMFFNAKRSFDRIKEKTIFFFLDELISNADLSEINRE